MKLYKVSQNVNNGGDSLRKQEERSECCGAEIVLCKSDCQRMKCGGTCSNCLNTVDLVSTPKVATSEKEPDCDYGKHSWSYVEDGKRCIKCKLEIPKVTPHEFSEKEHDKYECEECIENMREDTPHESEDWSESKDPRPDINKVPCACGQYYAMLDHGCYPWVEEFSRQFSTIFQGSMGQLHKESVKTYIQRNFIPKSELPDIESKAYQRGREEGEGCEGLEAVCNVCKSGMRIAIKTAQDKLLSIAVQEIEKEKIKVGMFGATDEYDKMLEEENEKFNQGLDKAKSIISGVMKK